MMLNTEERALNRAVLLLLIVSVARWGWSTVGPSETTGDTVLPELLSGSREVTADAAERSAPLGTDERVDPNVADEIQLDRLPGVGPVTARSIAEARDSGLLFERAEDLLRVRGVGPGVLAQISPFLAFEAAPRRRPSSRAAGARAMPQRVDLNTAGLEELQSLPGVGPAIAARIIDERNKQMFRSVDDLLRVGGLGSITVERLRSRATVR